MDTGIRPATGPTPTTSAVLRVLAGTPVAVAAAGAGLHPADLTDAVAVYTTAGQAALEAQDGWLQVHLQFSDPTTAEYTAVDHLGPALQQAQHDGLLDRWWFIRKAPHWRVRCRPGPTVSVTDARSALHGLLDHLTSAGMIGHWRATYYEPETAAFGGPEGMDTAHDLFHADSRGVLDYLRRTAAKTTEGLPGRRETSILLCSAFLHGAGQDGHEQADVWRRVVLMRPLTERPHPDQRRHLTAGLHRLMSADLAALVNRGGPLEPLAPWVAGFTDAGRGLAEVAGHGRLGRGLRAVLAEHVIFHWNRLGLSTTAQAVLAWGAWETVMD